MNISAEIKELEERLSENKPIYRIWAYMESGDDIEIFSSPSAEETQEEMISIIKDSCISDVESYGISLGAAGNFDFYTFVPPKKPFDVEEELLNMEYFPNKGKYSICGYSIINGSCEVVTVFETTSLEKLKTKMRETIQSAAEGLNLPEYEYYTVDINGSDYYEFNAKKAYQEAKLN